MSDTGGGKCAKRLLALIALVAVVVAGGGYWAYTKALQPEPLDFPPFKFKALEQPALLAKFEVFGGLKSLLTGDETTEVTLTERQFNGLLFGEAGHTADDKARFLVDEDTLRFASSRKRQNVDSPSYVNIVARVRLDITPDATRVEVLEGQVGDLPVNGPLKTWVGDRIAERFQAQRAQNPRLKRLKALWVTEGEVHLVYTPPE